jgi:hypothetical protein
MFRGAKHRIVWLLSLSLVALMACDVILPGTAPTPARQITYDGAVTLTAHAGETLPGTNIAYDGKAPDGRALVRINGLQGLKSTADSVNWSGALVLFSLVELNLRVITYNESSLTLAGTVHIVVQDPHPEASDLSPNPSASFTIPITYSVDRGNSIPGSLVTYVGAQTGGAEFTNLDQIPLRERFDSVVWQGHLRERIAVRHDLRVLDFNADRVILGGTTRIIFE